jgi:peptide methionine sulfoxide reductase msrA/msrB
MCSPRITVALALALWALLYASAGCFASDPEGEGAAAPEVPMVSVRVFNALGELVGPISMPRVRKTEAEWKKQLTEDQYRITRRAGTEPPFCGTLLDNKKEGVYACVCCALPLFASATKFHSGTGWPSFYQPIARENVAEKVDRSHGMVRTEINCARCDAHLGHVFEDGPRPTGLRYCLNSESLTFTDLADVKKLADPAAGGAAGAKRASAVFAGGCFWCVEAVFEELDGVEDAISGYAGGTKETANYKAVCTGTTGHAEAVQIVYDPAKISFEELLQVHFATHDPTTLNRQGADEGPVPLRDLLRERRGEGARAGVPRRPRRGEGVRPAGRDDARAARGVLPGREPPPELRLHEPEPALRARRRAAQGH